MFKDYGSLFNTIEETFDYSDNTLEAERDIRILRQKTSIAAYKAEFQILAAKIEWNDNVLLS
jgi:hypothetical protein